MALVQWRFMASANHNAQSWYNALPVANYNPEICATSLYQWYLLAVGLILLYVIVYIYTWKVYNYQWYSYLRLHTFHVWRLYCGVKSHYVSKNINKITKSWLFMRRVDEKTKLIFWIKKPNLRHLDQKKLNWQLWIVIVSCCWYLEFPFKLFKIS